MHGHHGHARPLHAVRPRGHRGPMSQYADEANPADVEEQATPLAGDEPETGAVPRVTVPGEADEADVLEQATPVSGDDDDYPNDREVEPDV